MSEIKLMKKEDFECGTKFVFTGGNNGHPWWSLYLSMLSKKIEALQTIYGDDNVILEKIETDVLDDIFYAYVLCYTEKGEN